MANFDLRINLTSGEYQQLYDQLTAQGYSLKVVSGYGAGGPPLFAALFEQGGGPPAQAFHDQTPAEYQQAFDQATAQGYHPTWINGYVVGGQPLFAVIFEQ